MQLKSSTSSFWPHCNCNFLQDWRFLSACRQFHRHLFSNDGLGSRICSLLSTNKTNWQQKSQLRWCCVFFSCVSRCLVLFARLILLIEFFFKVYCHCKQVIKISLSNRLSMPLKPPGIFGWIASFLTFPPLPLFRLLVLDFVWHPCSETLCPQSVKAEQPVCGLTPGPRDTSGDGDELESTGLTTQEQKFSFNLYFELLKDTKITAALTLNFIAINIGRSAFGVWPTKDFLL